jgi:hypothetical protein
MTCLVLAAILAAASPPAKRTPPAGADAPRAVAPPAATAAAEPAAIDGAEAAGALCRALVPTDRVRFEGSALERGDAESSHAAARDEAIAATYLLTVPAERIRFAQYSPDERTLSLYRHALPANADGSVRLNPTVDGGLPVEVDPQTARRILAALERRALTLDVTFALPEEEESPCFHVPGARSYTFAAEPVAWAYVADGAVLARGGRGADRPLVSARDGAQPRVRLGRAMEEGEGDARDLRVAALDRLEEVEACYASALDRDPFIDGAVVADVELPAGRGAPGKVRIAADTVHDADLVTCVRDVLATLEVRGGGSRAFLPIHFALEQPRADGAPDRGAQN